MSELLTVIPVYNGVHYLRATLESLARQTRRPDRVVVIDDCSTDGTCALVESFEEISCELVRNEKNLGLFPNLNHALEYAEDTEFFHLLLADDCIRPSFLETLVESLAQSSAPSFVYCSYDWIDSTGNVIQVGGKMGGKRSYPIGRSKFIYRQSLLQTVSVGSVVIRSGKQPLPVFFRQDMPHVADCVFYAELGACCGEILEIAEALCEIRRHSENATQQNTKNLNAWVTDEFRAMQRISCLMPQKGWPSLVHDHRQKCLFAARSRVKQQWTKREDPHFALQIGAIVARETAWYHRLLGRMAVTVRDLVVGRNLPDRPR
ncbi:MAG: glycosyltransferase family 2 protein [Verrucomicrobia bacterium]|nr:glycosyltransferase family 2 protein [Verrucomicrobiota bacterium]MDB4746123.1 glycosyltransferase family 2 protein [Verrucomicrobiota bacterium]